MTKIGDLIVTIGADIKDFVKGMDQVERRLKRGLGSEAVSLSQGLVKAFAGLGAGLAAVGGASIKMAADMEQSKIAFTTMLGSAEKAETFLGDLSKFAAETPFELPGLIDSSKKLLAFGFKAQEIKPMLTAIGDAVAGLGGGSAEIDRVTLALGQMGAKGKVSAQEMNQLAELGIPAWQMLADKIGMSIPQAMKAAEQGTISAAKAIPAILQGMTDKFGGMMQKQSTSLLGLWSTTKDNIGASMRVIGDTLVQTFDLKTKLAGANEWLNDFAKELKEGGLKQALTTMIPEGLRDNIIAIGGALTFAMIPALKLMAIHAAKALVPLAPMIIAGTAIAVVGTKVAKAWDEPLVKFGALIGTAGALTTALSNLKVAAMATSLSSLVPALGNVAFAFQGVTQGAWSFGYALKLLGLNPVVLAITAIAALTTAVGLYISAQKRAEAESAKKATSLVSLSDKYRDLQRTMDDTAKSEIDHKTAGEEQKRVIQEIGDLFPTLVSQWDAYGKAVALLPGLLDKATEAARENMKQQNLSTISTARAELEKLDKQRADIQAKMEGLKASQGSDTEYFGPWTGSTMDSLQADLDAVAAKAAKAQTEIAKATVAFYDTGLVYGPPIPKSPNTDTRQTGDGGLGAMKEVTALDILDYKLGQVDAAWDVYKAKAGDAAKGDVLAATQKAYLGDRLGVLGEKLQLLNGQYDASRAQTGEYSGATMELGKAISQTRKEIAETETRFSELSGPIAEAKDRLNAASKAVTDTKDRIAVLSGQLGTAKDKLEKTSAAVKDLEGANKDAKQSISDAFGVMINRAKDLEGQISNARSAMRDLANVRLVGEGALDDELKQLQQREALVRLALNELKQSGAGENDSRVSDLQKQLDKIGLLKENVQLRQEINIEPLKDQLKKLTDDTKEMTFEDAKAGIERYKQQIGDLTIEHTRMTTEIETLRVSVADLVPSIGLADQSFDEAKTKVGDMKTLIEQNNAKLSGENGLLALQDKQKTTVDMLTYGMGLFEVELQNLTSKQNEAASALDALRSAAGAAASSLGSVQPQSSTSESAPATGGGGGGKALMMANGGVLTGPTVIGGEAGLEPIMPLSWLDSRMRSISAGIVSQLAGSLTGPGLISGSQRFDRTGAGPAAQTGSQQAVIQVFLGEEKIAERTADLIFKPLRQAKRALGSAPAIG